MPQGGLPSQGRLLQPRTPARQLLRPFALVMVPSPFVPTPGLLHGCEHLHQYFLHRKRLQQLGHRHTQAVASSIAMFK